VHLNHQIKKNRKSETFILNLLRVGNAVKMLQEFIGYNTIPAAGLTDAMSIGDKACKFTFKTNVFLNECPWGTVAVVGRKTPHCGQN
jgi:hypothetical protein